MARILIVVGPQSGQAQMVADALKPELIAAGPQVDVTDMAATVGDLLAHVVFLVGSATHGSPSLPSIAIDFEEPLSAMIHLSLKFAQLFSLSRTSIACRSCATSPAISRTTASKSRW